MPSNAMHEIKVFCTILVIVASVFAIHKIITFKEPKMQKVEYRNEQAY